MAAPSFADYTKIFKPGTDLSTGKRDVFPYTLEQTVFDPSQFLGKDKSALEDKVERDRYSSDYGVNLPALTEDWVQKVAGSVALNRALQPLALEQARNIAQLQAGLSEQQIRQLVPAAQAVFSQNLAQNLAASKEFRAFKEQMPSSVQDIMASKQNQMASAAGAEASRQQATALQQQAAKQFAGSFAGKYIQAA